jgi:hypothetical protein
MSRLDIYFTDGSCSSFPFTGDTLTVAHVGPDKDWLHIGDKSGSVLVSILDVKAIHFQRGTDDVAS